jgi:RNA polymerase-binding transcription factor DksA
MNPDVMIRAEQSLLKELDSRLQSCWHESLQDVITDLRIHCVDVEPDAGSDKLISVIHSTRLLDFVNTQPLVEIRDTIQRIQQGTFGTCAVCGSEIPGEILESRPNARLCSACAERTDPSWIGGQNQSLPPIPLQ